MKQQLPEQSDSRDQKLAELELKLKQANQVIANLQQQNLALKKQFQKQQLSQNSQSNVVENSNETPISSESNSQPDSLEPKVTPNQPQISKQNTNHINRIDQLSHLHFYGLVTLVVCVIVGIFGVSSLIARKNTSQQPKTANTPPQTSSVQTSLPPAPNPPVSATVTVTNVPVTVPANPSVISQSIPVLPPVTDVNSAVNSDFIYNVVEPQVFQPSPKLKAIVNNLVQQAKSQNLSTENLSITLIDLNHKTIANYQEQTPRFPASVAKLFWLVILQAKLHRGSSPYAEINSDMREMIVRSDNDAASKIIDYITNAPTREKLAKAEYQDWKDSRDSLNIFFRKAGYEKININQKTFPIPEHYGKNISAPQGSDLQIRGDNPKKPIRNKVTSFHAARLMYEIVTDRAVSPQASHEMKNLLNRDLRSWQTKPLNPEEFHPVKNFLGERLPVDGVKFISKAGWTTNSREEVAYVETRGGAKYVIAVFGDDAGYAKSQSIFPNMSDSVFKKMTN